MSELEEIQRANVELARANIELVNQREYERALETVHPEELHDEVGGVGQVGTYHGREVFERWAYSWWDAWEEMHNESSASSRSASGM